MAAAKKTAKPAALSKQDVAKVAASAGVDPRTVARALAGSRQSSVVRAAIVAALQAWDFHAQASKLEGKVS
jgi:DNA-binding LacI/PurR family transcriptional regulator